MYGLLTLIRPECHVATIGACSLWSWLLSDTIGDYCCVIRQILPLPEASCCVGPHWWPWVTLSAEYLQVLYRDYLCLTALLEAPHITDGQISNDTNRKKKLAGTLSCSCPAQSRESLFSLLHWICLDWGLLTTSTVSPNQGTTNEQHFQQELGISPCSTKPDHPLKKRAQSCWFSGPLSAPSLHQAHGLCLDVMFS